MTVIGDRRTASTHGVTVVLPAARLRGEPGLPGDKSISHRALLLALLAEGPSVVRGASGGADVASTAGIVEALGATVIARPDGIGGIDYEISSPGIDGLRQPQATLDCGNAGTTLRLVAGILAGQPMTAVLDGDASLRGRPVARIIEPLRSMGAVLRARRHDSVPPVTVIGRRSLRPVDWTTAVPSAQVKSAILLAGLRAEGTSSVHEAVVTRDHTERMLRARGVTVRSMPTDPGGQTVEIEGGQRVVACDELVPRDPSAAAFWLVAGAIHPDAAIRVAGVGTNPTRLAAIDVLRAMGARIGSRPDGDVDRAGGGSREPVADLTVESAMLRGIEVDAAMTTRAIDEIPILALAATQAAGRTSIRGAGELRVKESNRLAGIVDGLQALGAAVAVDGEDLIVDGPTRLHGGAVDARGDHRLAMTFAVAALIADGPIAITGASSAVISDPRFFAELERIRP